MKKSKVLSLVLAFCLIVTTFAGCGEKEKKIVRDYTLSAENEFPIVDEKVELTIFATKSEFVSDFETNEFTKWYEEKTNVHINWIVPSGDAQQSFNLMIASGEYPDVILGMGLSREQLSSLVSQDILVDISDEIEQYGYNIKKMYEVVPEAREIATFGDGIYGVPKVSAASFSARFNGGMWVYEPWLKKLGISEPQTTEEFYQMLKAFKEKDPNGNGKADEIPLAARGIRNWSQGIESYLMSAFIPTDYVRYYVEKGKVKHVAVQPEYREGLRYIKKLYDEGLLYQDTFIIDRTQLTAIGESETPILGASTGNYQGYFCNPTGTTDRYHEFVSIPPLAGPDGTRSTVAKRSILGGTAFMVTKECKDPALAVKWVDWLLSAEGRHKSQDQGLNIIREAKEGELGLDGQQAIWTVEQKSEEEQAKYSATAQNIAWYNCTIWNSSLEESIKTHNPSKVNEEAYKFYQQYLPYASKNHPNISINDEDVEEVSDYSALDDEIDAYFTKFVTGRLDLDKDWDAYVKAMNGLGLDKYIAILQRAYDSGNYTNAYDSLPEISK